MTFLAASAVVGRAPLSTTKATTRFAGQIVGTADHRGFGHERIRNQGRFDFHRAQTMARDVQHIVDAAGDGEIAVLGIADRAIAGQVKLAAEVDRVSRRLFEALRIAPDVADHRRPRALDDQEAALAPFEFGTGFIDDRGHDARERQRARTRHQWRHAGSGVIMWPPVSVCQKVSTIGHFAPPILL